MNNYVSLLPPEYVESLKKAAKNRKAAFIMLVATILSFGAMAVSFLYHIAERQKITAVLGDIEQVRFQIAQLSEIEARQQELLDLRDKIVEIQIKDPLLINAAAEIVRLIPSGVKLEALVLSADNGAARTCRLTCTGSAYDDIGRFMNVLKASGIVSGVVSDSSNVKDGGGVAFTLTVTLVDLGQGGRK